MKPERKDEDTVTVKVVEEIALVFRILKAKIDDESFVGWLANEITAYACCPAAVVGERPVMSISGDMEKSGIQPLIDVINQNMYVSNEFVQIEALKSLAEFAYGKDAIVCLAASKLGAIDAAAQAMAKFPENERIQQFGCLSLGNLALNDEVRQTIGGKGGVELVAKALRSLKTTRRSNNMAAWRLETWR